MSDEEKYKVIFNWMTENLKYDYAILELDKPIGKKTDILVWRIHLLYLM